VVRQIGQGDRAGNRHLVRPLDYARAGLVQKLVAQSAGLIDPSSSY
jgi:hypothetical protein